jgi:hypothetical protein
VFVFLPVVIKLCLPMPIMMRGCKPKNHFRFLQSLQRHRSEFRQTADMNHFIQRLIMDGGGFRQNGAMNVNRSYAVELRRQEGRCICVCATQQQKNGKR